MAAQYDTPPTMCGSTMPTVSHRNGCTHLHFFGGICFFAQTGVLLKIAWRVSLLSLALALQAHAWHGLESNSPTRPLDWPLVPTQAICSRTKCHRSSLGNEFIRISESSLITQAVEFSSFEEPSSQWHATKTDSSTSPVILRSQCAIGGSRDWCGVKA